MNHLMALLWEKKGSVLLFGVLVAAATFFGTTALAPRYVVQTDFMVVQASGSQDFYTLFKSSEYLGRVLSESIYSERFINAVAETGKVSAKSFLPTNKRDRLQSWREMVAVDKNVELGMLSVAVKSNSEKEATKVMEAITNVLINRNLEFRGGDEKAIEIRVLSGPISDRNPTPRELIVLSMLGFLVGAFVRSLLVALKTLDRPGGAHTSFAQK